jgi:hypothetical protein
MYLFLLTNFTIKYYEKKSTKKTQKKNKKKIILVRQEKIRYLSDIRSDYPDDPLGYPDDTVSVLSDIFTKRIPTDSDNG